MFISHLQVDKASTEDDLQCIVNNEFLTNSLVTAGWLQPLTLFNRHHAMQTLIVHDVLTKRQAPMDQLVKGLETLGVYDLIKSNPDLMKAHFVNTKLPLTSEVLINNLEFPKNESDKNKTKQLLIQAIKNLEKGL